MEKIITMDSFTKLFLYLPGAIIFLVGSGEVRRWMRMHKKGNCSDAIVTRCEHVIKKDNKDREVYNFYNVTVEFKNPETHHMQRLVIKSTSEYAESQAVKIFLDNGSYTIVEIEDENLFNPWEMMIGGALLILLALYQNQEKEIPAMICLSLVLVGAGLVLIVRFWGYKRRNLQPLQGEITELYTRQISKESKIIKGSKYTYYPIVKYQLDGKDNFRKCNINSSNIMTYKIGESLTLYYDPQTQVVIEKHAQLSQLIIGSISLVVGVLAGASILSVL